MYLNFFVFYPSEFIINEAVQNLVSEVSFYILNIIFGGRGILGF